VIGVEWSGEQQQQPSGRRSNLGGLGWAELQLQLQTAN